MLDIDIVLEEETGYNDFIGHLFDIYLPVFSTGHQGGLKGGRTREALKTRA
jgi:hypothetical protein